MRADQGLTLIELLIVIVILGILSAIIVFSVEGITNRGEAASCEASAQTVRIGAQAFYAQGQGPDQAARYPNDLQELADSDFVDTLPGTLSNGNLTLTFATGTFFVYNPTTGSVDSTGCGTVGNGGGGGGGGGGATVTFVNLAATQNGGQIPVSGAGGGNNLNPDNQPVTATFAGDCASITNVALAVDKDQNGSFETSQGNMAATANACVFTANLQNTGGGWPNGGGAPNVTFQMTVTGASGGPFTDFLVTN